MRRELVLAGLLAAGLLCVVRAHGVQVEAAARLQDFAGAKGCLSGIFRSAPSRTPLVVQSNSAPAKFVVQKKSQVLAAKKSLKKAAKKNKDPSVPKKLKAKEPSQKRGLSKQERKAQKKALKQAKQQKKAEKKAQKSQKPAAFGGRCACPAGETCCVGTKRKVQICQHKGGVCCPHSDFCCKSGHSCVLTDNGAYQCVRPGEKELPEAMLYKSFKPTAFVEVQRNVTFAKRSANTTSVRRAVRQAAKKAAAAAAKKAARAAIKAARRANKVAKQETKRAVKQATKKAAKKAAAKVARQAAKKAAKKAKAKAQKKQAKVAAKKAAKAHKKKLAKAAKKMAKGIKRKGKGKKRKGKKIPDYEWLMAKSRQQDLELLDRTKGKVRNHLFRANVDRLLAFFPGKGDPDKRLDRHIERAKRRAAALKKRLRADNKLVGAKRLNKFLKKKHKGRGKAPKKPTRAGKKRSKAVARQKFRQVNMPAKKAVGVEPVFNFH